MTRLLKALIRITSDLGELRVPYTLVGGLAVSARAEPRTTRDIDLAISVAEDRQAEALITNLRNRGYSILAHLEQDAVDRLATVRLSIPGYEESDVVTDLLFASSGIEPEIIAAAEVLARISHQVEGWNDFRVGTI